MTRLEWSLWARRVRWAAEFLALWTVLLVGPWAVVAAVVWVAAR